MHLTRPQDSPQMTTRICSTKWHLRHTSPSWASPFQCGEFYDDKYINEDQKSFCSDNFDSHISRLTSNWEETNSNYGSESYAPSRNMFQNADKEGLMAKKALPDEIMENETTEVVKEMLARQRWVLLCWILTWGQMKCEDICQAWREKLPLNFII